jgi:hypothetical protein
MAAGSAAHTVPSQARAAASAWVGVGFGLAGVGAGSGWHTWSVTSYDHLFEFIIHR